MNQQTSVQEDSISKLAIAAPCAACEEEPALKDSRYCRWCGILQRSMEEQYMRRSRMYAEQSREDVGVVAMADCHPARKKSRSVGTQMLYELLVFAFELIAFCVLGWYGQRLLYGIGLAIWNWVTR